MAAATLSLITQSATKDPDLWTVMDKQVRGMEGITVLTWIRGSACAANRTLHLQGLSDINPGMQKKE